LVRELEQVGSWLVATKCRGQHRRGRPGRGGTGRGRAAMVGRRRAALGLVGSEVGASRP
jgi:hypothetical protein